MKTTLLFVLSLFAVGVSAQLSGTYTVGTSPSDFATLHEARDSIYLGGISGPVTLLIKPGTYSTPLIWGNIKPTDTITIESQSGDTSNTSIVFSLIYEAHNLVFKNLKLIPVTNKNLVYTDKGAAIERCKNLVIDSCLVVGSLQRYYDIGFTISDCKGGLIISNNTFRRLNMGVVFTAYSSYNSKYHMGSKVISGNHFVNIETALKFGGYFIDTTIIAHNRIEGGEIGIHMRRINTANQLELRSGLMLIDGNIITNPSIKAIYLQFPVLSAGHMVLTNNMLSGGYSHSHQFYNNGYFLVKYVKTLEVLSINNIDIQNNSIWGGFVYSGLGVSSTVKNNAFYSDKQTVILHDVNPYFFENNSFYTTGGQDSIAFGTSNKRYLNFSDFPANKNQIWADPFFVSASDLHACSDKLKGAGTNNGIAYDFDQEPRSMTSPDIGADEFKSAPTPPCAFFIQECTDSSYTLRLSDSSPRSKSRYWKFSNGYTTSDSSFVLKFNGPGLYSFKLITSNPYGSDSLTSTINLSQIIPQVISAQQNHLSIDPGYSSYQWYKDSVAIPNANKNFYDANTPGVYSVLYTNETGCKVWAGNPTFLNTQELELHDNKVGIFPNPASSDISIVSPERTIKSISIFDMQGRSVLETTVEMKESTINIDHLPKGLYIIKLQFEDSFYLSDIKFQVI